MNVIIYGNGRIARVLFKFVKHELNVACFTVDDCFITDKTLLDLPVYPFDKIDKLYSPADFKILLAVGYHEMNRLRRSLFSQIKSRGYTIGSYIHPSVVLHDDVRIGEGNLILDNVSIQPEVKIGNNNFIWSNSVIAHGVNISDHCWIASGSVIAGDSKINSGCFLGINSTISHNVIIGKETFIGGSSLINRDTPSNSVHISRPAEKHRLDSLSFLNFTKL